MKTRLSGSLNSVYAKKQGEHREKQSYFNKVNTEFKTQYDKFNNIPSGSKTERYTNNNFADLIQEYDKIDYKVPSLDPNKNIFDNNPELLEDNQLENTHTLGIFNKSYFKSQLYLDKLSSLLVEKNPVQSRRTVRNTVKYKDEKIQRLKSKIDRDSKENLRLRSLIKSFNSPQEWDLERDSWLHSIRTETESFRSARAEHNFTFSHAELERVRKKKQLEEEERKKKIKKSLFRSTKKMSLMPRETNIFRDNSPIRVTADNKLVKKDTKTKEKVRLRLNRMASVNKTTRIKHDSPTKLGTVNKEKVLFAASRGTTKTGNNKFFKNLLAKLGKKLYKDSISKLKEKELAQLYEEATRTDFEQISPKIETFFEANNQNYLRKACKKVKPCCFKQN